MTDLLEPDGELWRWAVAHGGLAKDSLWPPDSETDAHNLAQAWTDAAKALRDAVQNSDQAAADVRQVWTDAAGFELYYSVHSLNHGGGGGESGIADLATAMDALAALSQDFSNKVSSAKFLIRAYIALNEDLFARCTSTAARLVFAINVAGQVAKIQKDLADKFGKPPEPKKPKKPHGFWGNVGEFFVGIGEGAKEMVLGFGALAGYADGHWSWSTAGQAWGGLGKFALAAATYAVPGLSSLDQTYGLPGFERGEMGRTMVDAGKSLVAWDDWSDDPARAGGKATFNIVSSVLGTKGAGAAMRGAGAAAAGSRVGAVAAAGRVLETTGSAITKIPTATEVAGKVVRKIPGVEGALSRVGLGRPAPDFGEPAVRREGGTTERPPEDPPGGGPPPENVPSRPQNRTPAEHPPERERAPEEDAPSERPADHTLSERPVEHGPSERAIEGASAGRPVEHGPSERAIEGASAERPIEHGPSERAVERPAEHVSPERAAEGAPPERAAEQASSGGRAEPAAQPGSVGETLGREAARHEPTPWRDAKAELDPRTQQAHLTGSLAPEREAHATAGVDRDHFLEQERWAGASSPEPKTPTQKVAFAFLRGIGVLHTGIDMIAGHDLLPTSKLTPLHPPKDHKPKTHEEKPPEPAPEPKPDDPGLPPKPDENAIAHVDPETLKVDRIDPPAEAKPTPEPTPAGAPHPPADIDSAINPTAGRTPHPNTGHGPHHEPPDPDASHGPHHDGPPDPDAGHGPHHEPPDPDAGHGPHPDDPPDPDAGHGPHHEPPDPDAGHGPHHDGPPDPDAGHGPHPDDPPTPDEVNARHAESTPSGSSYHAGDPDLGDLPHRVPPDPHGRHTVDVHITPDGRARIGDHHYTPKEFAEVLRRNADYDGGPIRLIGCDASSNAFAHGLARELDTEVLAPTKPAWTDSHGRVFSSDFEIGPDGRMRPRIPPDGEWNTHHPDGTTHPASDGFAPDTHHDVDADSARHRGNGEAPDDWRDRPGPNGKPHSENIKNPKYIEENYYRRVNPDGSVGLWRRPGRMNANPPHPELDLVDGKPAFKKDRPPTESLGYDEGRSGHFPPEHVPGEHFDTRNWRERDYHDIGEKIADREAKKQVYDRTPADSDGWVEAHNAKNNASESLGEEASNHAIRDQVHRRFGEAFPDEEFDFRPHPDSAPGDQRFQLVDARGDVRAEITPHHPTDGGKPGNTNFDQIWEVDYKNGGEPHYVVHEAKGPGGKASERYLPLENRTVKQGHPDYFDDTLKNMRRGDKNLAHALALAKLDGRLDYVEVRARVDESVTPHVNLGYDHKPYNGYGYRSPELGTEPVPPEERPR
ncbi:hypothetical protein [Amycolatopsis sp. NPDC049159]|uniref:WXG100-like domain-containing protein n=1 Tax=Amycolatopsis sp. NPDC049159 TaxID=3157210 RepID=UPI0033E85275